MGLDMYLRRFQRVDTSPRTEEHEEVGYWRKANAIHRWFVENVQGGEDDCDYHREVTSDDLIALRDICSDVIETIHAEDGSLIADCVYASDHLPTQGGFFFGPTEYEEDYIDGLKQTIAICNRVLETTDFNRQMIFYVSSW